MENATKYIPRKPIDGIKNPYVNGPISKLKSKRMKYVEVASPSLCLGVTLIAIAWATELKLP